MEELISQERMTDYFEDVVAYYRHYNSYNQKTLDERINFVRPLFVLMTMEEELLWKIKALQEVLEDISARTSAETDRINMVMQDQPALEVGRKK